MPRAAQIFSIVALAGAGALGFSALGWAQGDGSVTDNPDLLRGSLGPRCTPGTLCHFPPLDLMTPSVAVASPIVAAPPLETPAPVPPAPVPAPTRVEDGTTIFPAAASPASAPPAFDGDFALSLRGAYVSSDGDERFEMLAIPQVSLSRSGRANDVRLDAQATLITPDTSEMRIGAASVDGSAVHRLSPGAALSFNAGLDFAQDAPDGLTIQQDDVAEAPQRLTAELGAAYGQQLGRFDATISADLSRDWVGDTTLVDGTRISNGEDEVLSYGTALRVGYGVTPIVSTFAQAEAGRDDYAAEDADLGLSRSGARYALRGGVAAKWSDVLALEGSIGLGWRDYDVAALDDARSWLYGAALRFAPNGTTAVTAALETELAAGNGSSAASAVYLASLEADYRVNRWLALRASAFAEWDVPVDDTETSRSYGAGLGADFVLGKHTSASLDYDYGWREDIDAATPTRQEQRISGGITLQY